MGIPGKDRWRSQNPSAPASEAAESPPQTSGTSEQEKIRELHDEEERMKLRMLQADAGLIGGRDLLVSAERMDWMYYNPASKPREREDESFLLGQKIVPEPDEREEMRRRLGSGSTTSGSLFLTSLTAQNDDTMRRLREDPLVLIKQAELQELRINTLRERVFMDRTKEPAGEKRNSHNVKCRAEELNKFVIEPTIDSKTPSIVPAQEMLTSRKACYSRNDKERMGSRCSTTDTIRNECSKFRLGSSRERISSESPEGANGRYPDVAARSEHTDRNRPQTPPFRVMPPRRGDTRDRTKCSRSESPSLEGCTGDVGPPRGMVESIRRRREGTGYVNPRTLASLNRRPSQAVSSDHCQSPSNSHQSFKRKVIGPQIPPSNTSSTPPLERSTSVESKSLQNRCHSSFHHEIPPASTVTPTAEHFSLTDRSLDPPCAITPSNEDVFAVSKCLLADELKSSIRDPLEEMIDAGARHEASKRRKLSKLEQMEDLQDQIDQHRRMEDKETGPTYLRNFSQAAYVGESVSLEERLKRYAARREKIIGELED